KEWRAQELNPPSTVLEATAEYRAENDTVSQFLSSECEVDSSRTECDTRSATLYGEYKDWCAANAEESLSLRSFGVMLNERGILQGYAGRDRARRGIRLLHRCEPKEGEGP